MNVLVATDGSKYGQWGLNWVAKLPFVKPPRVTALHVLDSAWLRGPFRTRPEIQRIEARSARTLKKAKQQLASLKLKGTARKEQGAVAPTILKRAPKRDGLLVVGSQGFDALDRLLLGSVSAKLIEHAPCPVFIVKGEAVPLRRITLATDGSAASAKALEFVLSTFQPDRSSGDTKRAPIHVSVIHVRIPSPLAPITMKSTIPWIKYPGLKEVGTKLVEQTMEKLIRAGFSAEPLRPIGKPAERIMEAASTQQADLIVMGAKGLGAIDRFLLGSVSTRVVQDANCAVLVVR
ncbi:MAG: universal stress protein [Nitrospira sp.]|nr:universal stress protein [Nitrospira sp.]